jgi:hypothetical protein
MSSSKIPEEKLDQIRALLRGRVNDLRVLPSEGSVVLHGQASTYYAKQLAQHHVVKILGLPVLVNEIEVKNGYMIGPFCFEQDELPR